MFYNVNISKSIVNFFNICLFTGNTCIYNFLSVFLRHLGLSPFQVGLLRGLQSFVALICIPIVILCGRKCLQRRPPMMSCLFLTMAAYLSLLVISLPAPSCFHKDYPVCENFTGHRMRNHTIIAMTTEVLSRRISQRSTILDKQERNPKLVTNALTTADMELSSINIRTDLLDSTTLSADDPYSVSSLLPNDVSGAASQGVKVFQQSDDIVDLASSQLPMSFSSPIDHSVKVLTQPKEYGVDKQFQKLDPEVLDQPVKNIPYHPALQKVPHSWGYHRYSDGTIRQYPSAERRQYPTSERQKRSDTQEASETLDVFSFDKYHQQTSLWPSVDVSCLIILLVILLIGEASASPVESIASDAWYTYLDEIDYLVAYTKRSVSIPICASITVFLIGCITLFYCGYGTALNAYNLHIYLFGIFYGFALVVTFFYPFPQEQKSFYRGLISIRYCFQSKESFVLFTTAIISGIPQAAITEFALWFIEDIGGSEFTTSTAITVGLLSASTPQLFSKKMLKLTSPGAMVSFGMFCGAAQFLLFVAIQMPWVVVASQILQCGSNYLFWTALKQRLMKILKLKTEHSLSLTLRGFHLLGYSIGAMANGLLFSYSPTILFSAMALLSLVWCLVLFFFEFCCRKSSTTSLSHQSEEEMKLFDEIQQDSEDD